LVSEILSVNVGRGQPTEHSTAGRTAIDKCPVVGPVELRAPDPDEPVGSGVVGDEICDVRFHGGSDRAVYAYAREDLDQWAVDLDRPLRNGMFGENLTTTGVDLTGALIGERWRVGADAVLEITMPRIPCRTFAAWLGERGWLRTFVRRGHPGAMLRVLRPGLVRAGDPVTTICRPDHGITVGFALHAVFTEQRLLPQLLVADALAGELRQRARRHIARTAARSGHQAGQVPSQ
jgi:MOSC domain-containing protein YiiM